MFQTLVASGIQAPLHPARLLASTCLHGLLVAAAIALTGESASPAPASPHQNSMIFVSPQVGRTPPPAHGGPAPSAIPPVPLPRLDTPDLSAVALPVVASDLVGRRNIAPTQLRALIGRSAGGARADSAVGGEPRTAAAVDEPVEIMEQSPARYPAVLERAGVGGRVELEYVVDTLGRAEPTSVRLVASSHPGFEAAARAAVLASRYRPARARGQLVRQLVRQALSFRPS